LVNISPETLVIYVQVDADDVTNDFQPVMLIDSDIDWATKALLDWRVGVAWDKEKEAAILARWVQRGVPKLRRSSWRKSKPQLRDQQVPSLCRHGQSPNT
jgi:hypothetical protein